MLVRIYSYLHRRPRQACTLQIRSSCLVWRKSQQLCSGWCLSPYLLFPGSLASIESQHKCRLLEQSLLVEQWWTSETEFWPSAMYINLSRVFTNRLSSQVKLNKVNTKEFPSKGRQTQTVRARTILLHVVSKSGVWNSSQRLCGPQFGKTYQLLYFNVFKHIFVFNLEYWNMKITNMALSMQICGYQYSWAVFQLQRSSFRWRCCPKCHSQFQDWETVKEKTIE